MSDKPTPVRLHVVFNGRPFVHDAVLPADWVRRCGHDDLEQYVQDELLPEALEAAGLKCVVEVLDDAPADGPPHTMADVQRLQLQKLGRAMSRDPEPSADN